MQDDLTLQAYHYDLPEENIAQYPVDKRDRSRLLVLDRTSGTTEHLFFHDIVQLFNPGDRLVVNDTKVFPARLTGRKSSGGKAEVFLLNYPLPLAVEDENPASLLYHCEALIKASRSPKKGSRIIFNGHYCCTLLENHGRGKWLIKLALPPGGDLNLLLGDNGEIPLPPYIKRPDGPTSSDSTRYQTIYADQPGAIAAPTAGLHFTKELLGTLSSKGVAITSITLHVGYGTFAPVQVNNISNHVIHQEYVEVGQQAAIEINATRRNGGRVWAVGTTTARALEYAAQQDGQVKALNEWCDLYITPGFTFRAIDNLITNFHLPRSSLLFLVSALCGRKLLLSCYQEAIRRNYRFYSYGDAMAIIK